LYIAGNVGYQNTRAHDVITVIVVIRDDGCSKATSFTHGLTTQWRGYDSLRGGRV